MDLGLPKRIQPQLTNDLWFKKSSQILYRKLVEQKEKKVLDSMRRNPAQIMIPGYNERQITHQRRFEEQQNQEESVDEEEFDSDIDGDFDDWPSDRSSSY
eukprot:TRINITY_DN12406_c0_g1_i1.p1 TRINITY_DN12406_c0_g1~~TRINITY_DN12406_c0_g1_i1.p1  ORF type:complete len:100 (+),score=27.20 TRINITY_DN12406_c0_g1_i1:13-312(+)